MEIFMITYKPKNTAKKYFSSLKLLLILVLIGGFATLAMYSGQSADIPTIDAEPPVFTMAEPLNLSGEWVGTGTEDYGIESRYDIRLNLVQEGGEIYGIQYMVTSNNEPEINASSRISGTFDGEIFYYVEGEVLNLDNISPDYWCLASVTLSYETIGGQDTLVGTWGSSEPERAECQGINGRVILTRQPD
jgi:hypothetical protein